ncbi:MAG: hypothetical protein ACO24P_00130 [Candidatus Nanopelagicaceae bacterium]
MANSEGQQIQKICEEIHLLILEDHIAEAALLLFHINKQDIKFWFKVKIALFKNCSGHRELFLMASLFEVAERQGIDQSFHLVPGLYALRPKES